MGFNQVNSIKVIFKAYLFGSGEYILEELVVSKLDLWEKELALYGQKLVELFFSPEVLLHFAP
jgi:hypothetical protein